MAILLAESSLAAAVCRSGCSSPPRPRRRWPSDGSPGGSISVLRAEDLQQGAEWRYDISRINELRRIDAFYRLFQPAIQRARAG